MKYYEPLYVDENYKSVAKIKISIKWNRIPLTDYVITVCNGKDQLEIIQGKILKQKFYPNKNLFVVGVSKSYEGAIDLVEMMLQDTFEATGNYDMKSYFLK